MKALMRTAVVSIAVALLILAISSLHLMHSPSDSLESRRGQELQRLARAALRRQEGWRQTVQEWIAQRCTLAETMQRLQGLDREFGQEWPADNSIVLTPTPPSDQERHYHLILHYAVLVLRERPQELLPVLRRLGKAFDEEPKLAADLGAIHRYHFACVHALLTCRQGKYADKLAAPERARLRQQALDWLRVDLKAHQQAMEKSADKFGAAIAHQMQEWLETANFASVRSAESLAQLPEAEGKDWHKLWQEVEALRQRAAPPPKTASSARL